MAAYRLVAESTVERRSSSSRRKRALADTLFGDEKSFVGTLTREHLELLLG